MTEKKQSFRRGCRYNFLLSLMCMCMIPLCSSFRCEAKEAKTAFQKEKPAGFMATAVKDKIALSWEPIQGASEYEIYEAYESVTAQTQTENKTQTGNKTRTYTRVKRTKNCRLILKKKEAGTTYSYYVRAYRKEKDGKRVCSKKSKVVSTTVASVGVSTIKNFLKTALAPVGSTMYVWGGGWNRADTGAGKDAKRIGVSPAWREFTKKQTASYDYRNHRYKIHQGLDCSGYVGWAVYNVLHTEKNKKGYVYSASRQAKKFSELGFGKYRSAAKIKDYKAGDIMSSSCACCGHVWIALGQCEDGSVILLHSSPGGVQLNGTVDRNGKTNSRAVRLARTYMRKYYKSWYKKHAKMCRGAAYLSHYGQMRWKTTGKNAVLSDPEGYCDMQPEEILKDLFDE